MTPFAVLHGVSASLLGWPPDPGVGGQAPAVLARTAAAKAAFVAAELRDDIAKFRAALARSQAGVLCVVKGKEKEEKDPDVLDEEKEFEGKDGSAFVFCAEKTKEKGVLDSEEVVLDFLAVRATMARGGGDAVVAVRPQSRVSDEEKISFAKLADHTKEG